MCGLVGIAGNLLYQDEFTMKRLLMADYFRGPDSTGFAAIRTNGDAFVAKLASNPIDLFNQKNFDTALNGNASRAFIGHNRAATRGKVVSANAHPFHFGSIVGAHNGTLDQESWDRLEEKLGEKYTVDSMALIAAIDKLGIEKTIKLCNEGKTSAEGAWALTWYDQSDDTMNFLRNKHRPLYYAYEGMGEDEKQAGFRRMFWASEFWMMREAVASALPGKYDPFYTLPDSTVGFFMFDEDVHYKYKVSEICEGSNKPPKPKCKKLKGQEVAQKAIVPFDQGWPRQSGHSGAGGTTTGGASTTTSQKSTKGSTTQTQRGHGTNTTTTTSRGKRTVLQLAGSLISPYAGVITFAGFDRFHQNCKFCGTKVRYGDLGITLIQKEEIMLCRRCSGYADNVNDPAPKLYVSNTSFEAHSS